MEKKHALIIGGSGALSGCLARMALEHYEVYTVTRGYNILPQGVHPLTADRNDIPVFSRTVLNAGINFDVVFDCICMNQTHARQDIELLSKVCKRFVIISTDSVYDPAHKQTPQTEESDYYCHGTDYAGQKRAMEEAFLSAKMTHPELSWTIFRPGHIYGPGLALGCFPQCSRDNSILDRIRENEPLPLVGGGIYLIHPIYVDDLAETMLACVENQKTFKEIFCIGGPTAMENRLYYQVLAKLIGMQVYITEIPLLGFLDQHPEYAGHLCHRIYSLDKLAATGIKLPETTLEKGLFLRLKELL